MAPNSTTEILVLHQLSWPLIHSVLALDFWAVIVEIAGHVLLLLVSVILAWTCIRLGLRRSADHVLYSTLGLFLCVGEAQLLMCHSCWWEGALPRRYLHACLGALGLWTGFLGILSKILSKRRENKRYDVANQEAHFASKHGYCGLAGFLLLGGTILTGLVHVFLSQVLALHLAHRVLGSSCFLCLTCSQWFGYNSAFARRNWPRRWILCLKLATLGAALCVGAFELWRLARDVAQLLPPSRFLRLDEGRKE